MHSQKREQGKRAILVLTLLVLVCAWVGAASAQNAANSAKVAKPALPDSSEAAKSGQPAAPDTTPPRVTDVHSNGFVIGVEDILNINVWKEPEMSRVVPVRPDGMITLPLIGEIKATGLTPLELQDQLSSLLKKFLAEPQVTVIVVEVHSLTFNVVGQVLKPGYFPLTRRMTVLDAIAMSGGFQPFAKQKKVYVLRTNADGKQVRLTFNYKEVIKGKHSDQNIELQPRDTVVVP